MAGARRPRGDHPDPNRYSLYDLLKLRTALEIENSHNKIKKLVNRIILLRLLKRHLGLKMVEISMRNGDFCAANHTNKYFCTHTGHKSGCPSRKNKTLGQFPVDAARSSSNSNRMVWSSAIGGCDTTVANVVRVASTAIR